MDLSSDFSRVAAFSDLGQKIIDAALKARRRCLGYKGIAVEGDCVDVAERVVIILKEMGISAMEVGGQFITDVEDGTEKDHTWVEVEGQILDPTIDQYADYLDIYLKTVVPGVYYSNIDGGSLDSRYKVVWKQ